MRLLMHALVGLLVSTAATPTLAELQWQSAGVEQVSHTAPTRRPVARRAQPAAKAPTMVRKQRPAPVQQAVAQAPPARRVAVHQAVRQDTAVQPACAECGCHNGCDCGVEPYYDEAPGCGVPGCGCEPSCGFVGEPTCGLTYGEPSCGCGDIGCGGGCAVTCGCGGVCDGSCGLDCVPVTICVPPIRELTIDAGVQAFKNPLDRGRDRGNFGFNYGVNLGGSMSLFGTPGLGYQIGYRGTSNQLHGVEALNTADGHDQSFVTAGLFHRKAVGLQYGVVYDMLRDERQGSNDFGQIRGLISVTNPRGHEIGFQFASHTNENILPDANGIVYHATSQYLAFYRMHGCQGGEFRVFGGFDDDSKGILGADFAIPLTERWSLDTGFTYVIPEEGDAGVGSTQEAWNLGMNLVWHYGCRARQSFSSQYRPMFRVADNGSLIIDDRQP